MGFEIIHCADFHIGASKHILASAYLERQKKMLYEIKHIIEDRQVKVLVITGDIFEKGKPTQDEKDMFIKWVSEIDDLGFCKIIITLGNHDEDQIDKTALDTFIYLKTKFKNVKCVLYVPENVIIGNICFACIPWKKTQNIYESTLELYDLLDDKSKKFVVLCHYCLPTAKTDTNHVISGEHKLLEHKFVIVYLMGDIHRRHILNNGRIQMVGAPIQHIWSDKMPKGISLINSDHINSPELVELNVQKLLVTKSIEEAKNSNCIIKLVTNDIVSEELPDNIVDVVNYLEEEEVIDYKSEFNVLEGLTDYLAEKGFPAKLQQKSIEVVESICKELGVQ
jgi:Icc-related predicted phosphoesterase